MYPNLMNSPGATHTDGNVLMCFALRVISTWLSDDWRITDTPTTTPRVLSDDVMLAISEGVRKQHGHPAGCYSCTQKTDFMF